MSHPYYTLAWSTVVLRHLLQMYNILVRNVKQNKLNQSISKNVNFRKN